METTTMTGNQQAIKDAIVRLEKALQYGDNMKSSRMVCMQDAIDLINLSMNSQYLVKI